MHCRMFNSIVGLYPADANSMPSIVTTKNASTHCQVSPGRQNRLWLRTTVLESRADAFPNAHSPVQCVRHQRDGRGKEEKVWRLISREGFGKRIVPGACKALVSVVKKKGQRKGGDLETLPRISTCWVQPGRPSWYSEHMVFTKKSW